MLVVMFKKTDIAFVTGGGSGIGRATCELLAEQGATVVVADINNKSADETVLSLTGEGHYSVHLDVSKKKDVQAVIADVTAKYSSPPTIAVNCAGVHIREPLLDASEEKFNRLFNVNVKGTIWVTQALCEALMAAKKKGSIINLTSIAKKGLPLLTIYSSTKGGVKSFTLSVAKEFGPHGIRVNAVSPGWIDTPMSECFKEMRELFIQQNPLRKTGRPKEVADVVAFLASDQSSYVNGTTISIDGGGS